MTAPACELALIECGAKVRAILDGSSQTRRLAKFPDEGHVVLGTDCPAIERDDGSYDDLPEIFAAWGEEWSVKPPLGPVGRRLYVKETYGLRSHTDVTDWYRGSIKGWKNSGPHAPYAVEYRADYGSNQDGCFWRSSIFMPRWASRITVEVTGIRVERVQDISVEDAIAEGFVGPVCNRIGPEFGTVDYRKAFEAHWRKTIGLTTRAPYDGAWEANPRVWVYEFKRVRP